MEQRLTYPLLNALDNTKDILNKWYMDYLELVSGLQMYFPKESRSLTDAVKQAQLWCQPVPNLQSNTIVRLSEPNNPCGRTLISTGLSTFLQSQAGSTISLYLSQYLDTLSDEVNKLVSEANDLQAYIADKTELLNDIIQAMVAEETVDINFIR